MPGTGAPLAYTIRQAVQARCPAERRHGRRRQANDFAGSLLVPSEFEHALARVRTAHDVRQLAEQLNIAPAIVAGRIQRDRDDYRFGVTQGLFVKFEIVRGSQARETE
jgi:uncharacterized protein (DUF885 family)